uniref:Zona occludens toxin N-terminal domain-containing protein n=1 Tax=Chromera velia CCMP2878 TaxID=1169474 RepID=A0A0G4I1T7_9ALVE|eukprot:Cvel_10214.t1-p1 / transcript=Cvel_10214.t1 / gene=Cvel_10214 / organism=Chromera_velia_CCMP2878 / gene_product=hypothetical protein / transcript_product=hypothetical protein / location=Cvel_scaffold611:50869-53232(-) / protein_length=788 / sequence_SO=supercontig / SO=protein_coding / is_pseudo=false
MMDSFTPLEKWLWTEFCALKASKKPLAIQLTLLGSTQVKSLRGPGKAKKAIEGIRWAEVAGACVRIKSSWLKKNPNFLVSPNASRPPVAKGLDAFLANSFRALHSRGEPLVLSLLALGVDQEFKNQCVGQKTTEALKSISWVSVAQSTGFVTPSAAWVRANLASSSGVAAGVAVGLPPVETAQSKPNTRGASSAANFSQQQPSSSSCAHGGAGGVLGFSLGGGHADRGGPASSTHHEIEVRESFGDIAKLQRDLKTGVRSEVRADADGEFESVSSEEIVTGVERDGTRDSLYEREALEYYMGVASHGSHLSKSGVVLSHDLSEFEMGGLMGTLTSSSGLSGNRSLPVYLNVNEPFCFVTVGVQGAGKSHTLASILEAFLLPHWPIVKLQRPLAVAVFHYDQNQSAVCEALGLHQFHHHPGDTESSSQSSSSSTPHSSSFFSRLHERAAATHVKREDITVLVTPSNYRARRAFYGDDSFNIRPLVFRWKLLSADHIKRLMRVSSSDTQLYMSVLLGLLQQYQREGKKPGYREFCREIQEQCGLMRSQEGPLLQRLRLLDQLVDESEINQRDSVMSEMGGDFSECLRAGAMVVVDLTDPMLAKEEPNGIFHVLTEQFRACHVGKVGKLLALDEAHKFMDGKASDGLSGSIVDVARTMRHDGTRLAISTQAPLALSSELLELVSVAALHNFCSREWFAHLRTKLPLRPHHFDRILRLHQGESLVFARKHKLQLGLRAFGDSGGDTDSESDSDLDRDRGDVREVRSHRENLFAVLQIRQRITMDLGASIRSM